jgi:peptidoglycan/LPS O-acetylase OafA/YrhL
MIVASILMAAWLAFWSRSIGSLNLASADIVVYLLVGLAAYRFIDGDNPLTDAYLAWPFLGGVTGMAILMFTKRTVWKISLLCLAAFMVLAVMVPQLFMGTFSREGAWLPVMVTCLVVGLLTPQIGTVFSK